MTGKSVVGMFRSVNSGFGIFAAFLALVFYAIGVYAGGSLGVMAFICAILLVLFVAEGILWQFARFRKLGNILANIYTSVWGALLLLFAYIPLSLLIIYLIR